MTPKPYISFSQLTTFERSPEQYLEQYVYGHKKRISRNMAYGSKLADGLEKEESNGDPLLDLMAAKLPKFERMDKPVTSKNGVVITFERDKSKVKIPVLPNKGGDIPLLAVPDSSNKQWTSFKEYKTSTRKWTQKMVDESGQITFYATAIWLTTGKVPTDIELVNIQTAYQNNGSLTVTGDMYRFPTKRTLADIIKMCGRIRSAWKGIQELCQKELL